MISPTSTTAKRIVQYVTDHSYKTKHAIAAALNLSDSTIEGYIGPLKELGLIKPDDSYPPRYLPGNGRIAAGCDAESVKVVIGAMHAMVSIGNGERMEKAA